MIAAGAAPALTAGGIAFLLLGWGGIIGLTVFCFHRILKARDRKR